MHTTEIVDRAPTLHSCLLPGWWERRKRHIGVGTVIRCQVCGKHWRWNYRGWFDDSGKDWEPVRRVGDKWVYDAGMH